MNADYSTLQVEKDYETDTLVCWNWSCNLGFGQVIVEKGTNRLIESECMTEDFCRKVIEKGEGK